MKKILFWFFILSTGLCTAQTLPAINGKPLVDVRTVQWNFVQRPAGWYRIAKIPQGHRGNATFELRENADHSTLRFEVGINFNSGRGDSFSVTNHSFYSAATFEKVRILSEGTYADVFLEVYINPHNNDNQSFSAYLINAFADGDWQLENWAVGSVPTGYASSVFEVNHLFTVGNSFFPNAFSVSRSGNVGIGTASPTEKLSVKGNIRAQEIRVEAGDWPDYVFNKDYTLTSLEKTEKHIKKYGFLPGMPSAKEVEANGVELGDMNKKLLLKLEELTLHMIELKKEVSTLRKQNKMINKSRNLQKGRDQHCKLYYK